MLSRLSHIFVAILVTLSVVIGIVISSGFATALLGTDAPLAVAAIATFCGVMIPAIVYRNAFGVTAEGGTRGGMRALAAVGVGAGLASFGTGAAQLMQLVAPMSQETLELKEEFFHALLMLDRPEMIPLVFIGVALLPGVCEEYLFRGVLRERLAPLSETARVLTIAICFTVLHTPETWVPMLGVGAVLTLMAERTQGWVLAAVAHLTLNSVNGLILPRVANESWESAGVAAALAIGGVIVCVLTYPLLPRAEP